MKRKVCKQKTGAKEHQGHCLSYTKKGNRPLYCHILHCFILLYSFIHLNLISTSNPPLPLALEDPTSLGVQSILCIHQKHPFLALQFLRKLSAHQKPMEIGEKGNKKFELFADNLWTSTTKRKLNLLIHGF